MHMGNGSELKGKERWAGIKGSGVMAKLLVGWREEIYKYYS